MDTIAGALPPPPTAYACPRCLGIVPGVVLVSYHVGLTQVDPVWTCDRCLVELEQLEAENPSTIAGYVWAVAIEGPTRGRVVALERRRLERAAHDGPGRSQGPDLLPRADLDHAQTEPIDSPLGENDRVGSPRTPARPRPGHRTPGRGGAGE